MISKIKKPVSVLLSLIMVFSLFTIVPLSASAAVGEYVAENEFLTFTALEAKSSVTLNVSTGSNLQYNKNNSGWKSYTVGAPIELYNGEIVRFRGKDTTFNNSKHVSIGGKVMCRGNVMSLRLDEESRDQGLSDSCFQYMFKDCTGLKTAPELPETTLANRCYYGMFSGCRNLIKAPDLPATALANNCYGYMFENCESLIRAPELPATSLEYGCYSYMFSGCENLTADPELPATTLAGNCYRNMFSDCTSLTTAPELPATTLESNCYNNMFYRCTSLTTAPELPATTLASYCYNSMFSGCTSLTTAPELPATTLESYCYNAMFFGCSSIKLSETQTAEYSIPYSVPSGGNGTTASAALNSMFAGTGGTFKGTPEINKTYYRPAEKYTVTWKNDDGTTIDTTTVKSGVVPTHADPTKAEDANYTYTFAGWSPEITAVTGDVTYTATFTAVPTASYVERSWDGSAVTSTTKSVTDFTVVASDTTAWNTGWYVVRDEVTVSSRIIVSGTVNLILCDNAKLTANLGIRVQSGNTLNIFGQTEGTGALIAKAQHKYSAAIGSYKTSDNSTSHGTSGKINIHGGNITATGGAGDNTRDTAAAIGGAVHDHSQPITIYGGVVVATGGKDAPGIGAGWGRYTNMSSVNIYGGDVTAYSPAGQYGGQNAIGKGAGSAGNRGTVTIAPGLTSVAGSTPQNAKACETYELGRTSYVHIWGHTHDMDIVVNGDTLTMTCSNDGCNIDANGFVLTINAENAVYDGSAHGGELTAVTNPYQHKWNQELSAIFGTTVTTDVYYEGTGDTSYVKTATAPVNVGTYKATYTLTVGNESYTIEKSFIISKKSATIKIDDKSKTYLDEDPELTAVVKGTVNDEALNYTLTREPGNEVDAYTITAVLGDNPNYDVTVENGTFTINVRTYTITFNNEDGSEFENVEVPYGDVPSCSETPTKEADANYTYTFAGWTPEVVAATADATYTATFTAVPKEYVAQVGTDKYESLAEAITAAQDGDTITVIADTTVPCYTTQITGKAITIDATGYTVTGTGYTTFPMFNVKSTGGLTLAGGAFSNPGGIISNSGTAVVNGATLTAGGFAIQNKGNLTISSGIITATEAAVTNGAATAETTITGGYFTGKIKMSNDGDGTIAISGGVFDRDVDIYAAPGFVGVKNMDGTYGVAVDSNPTNGKALIEGYQRKIIKTEQSTDDSGNDIDTKGVRIVTKVDRAWLDANADDYGYVVAKYTGGKSQSELNFANLTANGGNGQKTISCKNTFNEGVGYGNGYVTLAVNGMNDNDKVVARFYVVIDGVTYYSYYVSTARYNGIIATY